MSDDKVIKIEPVVGLQESYIRRYGYRFNEGPDDPRDSLDDYLERTQYLTHSAKEINNRK